MMFLIRTAFWLTIVIALIPVDGREQAADAGEAPPLGAMEAIYAAQATASDLGGFCGRNPNVCQIGGRIASTMALKAKTGARMVYEWIDGEEKAQNPASGLDTLTEEDRRISSKA
ncbi:hypothetical protein HDIA_1323 [Hartmannibacter diazotrophicus]|uniref:DUF5330 domain-containing protein n=1 Tax=Hartmannibacter diazotrophicus TaxID=1482074 RepID=A0A2C9D3M0_9HYPH|nr:DUF5330 domain-containing protein [Hartmannibacter diazotrophicus]SON54864.1 hypothetical protein HDIA_1323 [Hartmannibacter diazotrophicus]